MLPNEGELRERGGQMFSTHMWNYEILLQLSEVMQTRRVLQKSTYLDVHEIVDVDTPEFRKLVSTPL